MVHVPTARHLVLARWALDRELDRHKSRESVVPAGQAACAALYRRLTPLVTSSGSQGFLTRSLHLAREQYPFLQGLRGGASPETCLEGLDEALRDVGSDDAYQALVLVLAHMIGLLATFIGDDLAMRILGEAWPNLPLESDEVQEEEA
jgi:hypothetical protein